MTCKTCNRAILPQHVDREGNCCFCQRYPQRVESSDYVAPAIPVDTDSSSDSDCDGGDCGGDGGGD